MSVYAPAGRVGVIDLSTCTSLIPEFRMAVPPEVLVLFSRLRLPGGEVSVESLDRMVSGERLEEAARELADADVAAITFACTSGSLLHGAGFDQKLRDRLTGASGVPSTTTATSVVAALHHLGAKTVCVGTPYPAEVDERERVFLEDNGFAVPRIVGLRKNFDREIGVLSENEVRDLARDAFEPGCDALFLSCTNLPALRYVAELEEEYGVPVVTSNSATIWHLIQTAGIDVKLEPSLGRLLAGRD
jgi:maleate isomerase